MKSTKWVAYLIWCLRLQYLLVDFLFFIFNILLFLVFYLTLCIYYRNWKVGFWGHLHSLTHLVSLLLKLLANKLRRNSSRGAFCFCNCYDVYMSIKFFIKNTSICICSCFSFKISLPIVISH